MKIYKDIFTGDEMFTDSYKMKLVDGVLYEVYGKYINRKHGDIRLEGANPSAEEVSNDTDEVVESGVDIVLNQRLQENFAFPDKKSFTQYLKEYTNKILEILQKEQPEEVDKFKNSVNKVAKELVGKFKELQFFTGESMDIDGMLAILEYREVDGKHVPVMMFLKHGLREEKY